MTEASKGLGKALARAGSKVLAIGEMSVADVLAGMSDEQKAELFAQAPKPAVASSDPEPDPSDPSEPGEGEKCSKCSEPMKDGKCSKCAPDSKADANASDEVTKARAEERARFNAVMSSEHYKGRESLAAKMLANEKLSADEIIGLLADAAPAAQGSDDAAAGAAMLAVMKAAGNPDTSNASGNANNPSQPKQEANHGWADIHAEIAARRGK